MVRNIAVARSEAEYILREFEDQLKDLGIRNDPSSDNRCDYDSDDDLPDLISKDEVSFISEDDGYSDICSHEGNDRNEDEDTHCKSACTSVSRESRNKLQLWRH
ncbi:unnamed protein product [Agarophyton chilense]